MPIIKIPDSLKKFFRKEGIDDLPRILELLATVSPVVVINTQDFPVQTFPGGKLIDNFTEVTLVSDTDKLQTLKVPPGKRWLLFFGAIYNGDSVNRACAVTIYNSAGKQLASLFSGSITTLKVGFFPSVATASGDANQIQICGPLPVKEGDYIEFYYAAGGASAGGTAYFTAVVLEIDV